MRLGEIARQIGAELMGDPETEIRGVAPLDRAQAGDLAFLSDPRHENTLQVTRASAVILEAPMAQSCPTAALVVRNPHLAFARAATLLTVCSPVPAGIHPSAALHPEASIDSGASIGPHVVVGRGTVISAGVIIGPGCVIGDSCVIGADTLLGPNVSVLAASIGRRVLVHSGAVIGADGFGFAQDGASWVKVPQLGRVRIGDDVEIGANTTVDRGALDDTVIGDGVKIDNLVQVAHNVRIGANTAIAGCVGIAGSARIGERCRIGGGAGILGHLEIADDVTIGAMSLVTRTIAKAGVYASGAPLQPVARWRRNSVRLRHLDEIVGRLEALERIVQDLDQSKKG